MHRKIKSLQLLLLTGVLSLFSLRCGSNPVSDSSSEESTEAAGTFSAAPCIQDKGTHFLMGDDIILNKGDAEHTPIISALTSRGGLGENGIHIVQIPLWPEGKIPYTLSGFSANELKVIQLAMDSIKNVCKVTFTQVAANGKYIYKISKINDPNIGGCSTLGYTSTSYCNLSQVLWGTCVHEFLHGLGIGHEHQRPDRDTYIAVALANVSTSFHSQFSVIPLTISYKKGQTPVDWGHVLTPYDYQSIMHYPATAFSKNSKATIVPKQAGVIIGQRSYLSHFDKSSVAGLYGVSNWTYVNKKPTVKITVPAANATFKTGDTVTFCAVPYDSDGVIKNVRFYQGTTLIGTVTASPYICKRAGFAAGTYQVKAIAGDNFNSESAPATVTLTVKPNTLPAVAIIEPVKNAVCKIMGSVTLRANASDADGTIKSVAFYANTTLVGTAMKAPYAVLWKNMAAGSYAIKAVVTDNSNGTATSATVPVVVRNKLPKIVITSPQNNSACGLNNLTLTAAASDSDGTIVRVSYYLDDRLLGYASVTPFTCKVTTGLTAGQHTLKATATDDNGGSAASLPVKITVQNNHVPVVSITAPKTGTCLFAGSTMTITASASDPDGTIKNVQLYNNTTLLATFTKAPFAYQMKSLAVGTYTLKAVATDNLNASATSVAVTVLVRKK